MEEFIVKQLEVVAGIIICNGEILCVQRGEAKYDYVSYKFEFPGGKIEQGETPVLALKRELQEELELVLDVREQDLFMEIRHCYPDFSIHMYSYVCRVPNKKFKLKEHKSYQWLKIKELETLEWLPADVAIVEKLMLTGDAKC
jgi:NTP pyrophosphohydrolases including oxidative damage repair enzymes